MIARLTGGFQRWPDSPDGLLHDTQPPASVAVASQQLGENGEPLVEPGSFFVDGNYSLKMTVWNAIAGLSVNLRVRFLSSDGRLTDSDYLITPTSDRIGNSAIFPLAIGFPLNVTAFVINGLPQPGQCFVQVQLVRGFSGVRLPVATILQDYVTAAQAIAFPGSPIRSALDGAGALRSISGTTPGPGAQITETVPPGARWKLQSFFAALVTSATVANRVPAFTFDDAAFVYLRLGFSSNQAASLTFRYNLLAGVAAQPRDNDNNYVNGVPTDTYMDGGNRIKSLVFAMDGTDQWSAVQYVVREWINATTL